MAKRSPRQKSKHDKAVKVSADYYKGQGFKVKADISGYPTPKTIRGRRPDVVAYKGRQKVVIEVETPTSIKQDIKQQEVFRKHATQSKNTKFRRKIAK